MNLTNEDLIGSLLPEVHISRVTLESSSQDKLLASVQFFIKENFKNDEISSWLEDSEILKYLKIFVIQSADERATELIKIAADVDLEQEIQTFKQQFNIPEQTRIDTSLIRKGLYNKEVFDMVRPLFFRFLDNPGKLVYKQIELVGQIAPSLREMIETGRAQRIVNSDGSKTYNIFFDIDFKDNDKSDLEENPQHLSYLYGTYVDLTGILRDGEFGNQQEDFSSFGVSELKEERIISNGQLILKSFLYTDSQDRIWPGKVHFKLNPNNISEPIIRSGETESENSVDLKRIEVDNYKILDIRQLRKQHDLTKIDTSFYNDQVFDFFNIKPEEQKLVNLDDDPFISDAFISVDSANHSSLTFFIDFKKMFIKKSIYGQVLDRIGTKTAKALIKKAFEMCTIDTLQVSWKRIDIDQSLVPEKGYNVIANFDNETIKFIEKPVLLQDIDIIQKTQIRMFSIPILQAPKVGKYKLNIEIGYKDTLVQTIQTIIMQLKKEQEVFKYYYAYGNSPIKFNEVIQRFVPDAFLNFSYLRNMLTENEERLDLDFVLDFYSSGTYYITYLRQLFGVSYEEVQDLVPLIKNYLNPVQGTPSTINVVIDLYDGMIKQLNKLINLTNFANNSLNEKNNGIKESSTVTRNSKIIPITKTFNNVLNLNDSYKMEYLNTTQTDNTGVKFSTDLSYENIKSDLLMKKIYPENQMNVAETEEGQQLALNSRLKKMFSDHANLKIQPYEQIMRQSNDGVLRDLATSISRLTLQDIEFNPAKMSQETVETEIGPINNTLLALLKPTVDHSQEKITFKYNTSNSESIFWSINPRNASPSVTAAGTGVYRLFNNRFTPASVATNLPNQIKSLILLRSEFPDNIIPDAKCRFRYEMLKRVKYLTGFTLDSETMLFNMSEPIWNDLKAPEFLRNSKNVVFCMLQDYYEPTISYTFNKALKSTTTNEYFILNDNINNRGKITHGATYISLQSLEQRATKELDLFFESENPSVIYKIGNTVVNPGDSYIVNKYSYFSPIGIYYNKFYRSLILEKQSDSTIQLDMLGEFIPNIDQNLRFEFAGFDPRNVTSQSGQRAVNKNNLLLSSIYSSTGLKKRKGK